MKRKKSSQSRLKKEVLEQSLCTGCGACVGLCPYQVVYRDRTVQLFDCDLSDGKCRAFCPRTPADGRLLRDGLFDAADATDEIGPVKEFWFTRAKDAGLRARAQHGGTVTALLRLAMSEGWIDAAIVSGRLDGREPEGRLIDRGEEPADYAGSRFWAAPTVAAFHRMPENGAGRVGVVATPCQALALAKIRTAKIDGYQKGGTLSLVIGLFCGWTLALDRFQNLLNQYHLPAQNLTGMDIPAGKNILELRTAGGAVNVPMDEVDECVREACRYCIDSTAEFADLSVGAARFGGNPVEMSGWNQVIVRSEKGKNLVSLARDQGILECREAPRRALAELMSAAAEKKKKALARIIEKSRSPEKLLYLNPDDPAVRKYLNEVLQDKAKPLLKKKGDR
ncbi:MAG TPA: Coenzyme F420 hydrogenase/dehydrogenase, beta subunit C-terminal domain [Smithellaceae bacterium]|mgnify:FL=1|nr:Coenzyme F420 hydrogenase/dehydrogenase, beta subunit C-terminal domain [Smithellaceae bacterium]HRV44775.1 Coenzyme F420 hydrogenase/dehydrogenase, beta subunit C-terminal domain [Smithellaceae bacterium]